MKIIIIIFLLLPCFLKAQVTKATRDVIDSSINANNFKLQKQTDSLFLNGDTSLMVKATIAGFITFDTVKIANNSIQGFSCDAMGFSSTQQIYAHIVFYVTNVNGKYTLKAASGNSNYSSGMNSANLLEVVQSLNSVIVRYRSASSIVYAWTYSRQKL